MGPITLYQKNKIHFDNPNVEFTITDAVATNKGDDLVNYFRDGSNTTALITTDSTDAANWTIVVNSLDQIDVDHLLLSSNAYAYTFKYWNGAAYVDTVPAVNEAANLKVGRGHEFAQVTANLFQLQITQCFEDRAVGVDVQKILRQLVLTKKIGHFVDQPGIERLVKSRNRTVKKYVSGKGSIAKRAGGFESRIGFQATKNKNDIRLVRTAAESDDGIIWSFVGMDDTGALDQDGFRNHDFLLMGVTNDPNWAYDAQFFDRGPRPLLELIEVVS